MTIQLELTPEIEAVLADRAKARGIPLSDYLQQFIEKLASEHQAPGRRIEDLRASLDKLAEMGRNLPATPSSAFRRESIYPES